MKHLIIILGLILASTQLWAQVDSVQAKSMEMASDSAFMQQAAQDYEDPSLEEPEYRTPRRNVIYYFGSSFAEHFADVKCMIGADDVGIGLNYTFIPEVWGFNVTGYDCFDSRWALIGFNYRLSKPWQTCDWQVYGDLGMGYYHNPYMGPGLVPALEAGIRLGRSSNRAFGHYSGTLGVLTDLHQTYVTFGLSLTLTTLASLSLLFGIL